MIHGFERLIVNRDDSSYFPAHDGKEYGFKKQNLFSHEKLYYSLNFIRLLDRVFTEKNLHLLSMEQQKLIERWFEEGNKKTRDKCYKIERLIQRFDKFLGSYRGERYPKRGFRHA
jgi:hypothetical protein